VTGDRWARAAAVTYVALFVAAHLLTTKGPCGTACFARATDERVVAFYEDSGNRWRVGIAYLLFGIALAAFLWFLARLHAAIAEIDGSGTLARLVVLGGGVYAALAVRRAGRRWLGALGVVLAALTFFFALQEGTLDRGVAITIGIQDVPFLLWLVVLAAIVLRSAAPPATRETLNQRSS